MTKNFLFSFFKYASYENTKILAVLFKAGAPVNLTNIQHQTPLDVAKQQGSGVMQKELNKKKYKAKVMDSFFIHRCRMPF